MKNTIVRSIQILLFLAVSLLFGFRGMAQYTLSTLETGGSYTALAKDNSNNIYATRLNSTTGNYDVVKFINGAGTGTVIYSGLTHGTALQGDYPWGIAVNSNGDVFVLDSYESGNSGQIIKLAAPSYTPVVPAIQSGNFYSAITIDAANNLYTLEYNSAVPSYRVMKYAAGNESGAGTVIYDGLPFPTGALSYPWGIALDSHNNIYITDFEEHNGGGGIIKLTAPGYSATTVATGRNFTALATDAFDNVYTIEATSSTTAQVVEYADPSQTGTVLNTTFTRAPLFYPWGLTVNSRGEVYANDGAASGNGRIVKLSPPTIAVAAVNASGATHTSASTVNYAVTFSAAATGVTAGSFSLTTTGSITGASIASVSGSGTIYFVTVNTGTGEGTIRLNVTGIGITPTVNNTPYITGQVYTIDRTPPAVTLNINSGALITNNTAVTLTETATDADALLQMRVSSNGTTWSAYQSFTGTLPFTLAPAGDGLKTVYIQVVDQALNVGATSATITLDQTPPVVGFSSTPPSLTNNPNAIFSLASVEDPNVTYQASVDGGTYSIVTSPDAFTVTEGPHTFSFRGKDVAGNISAAVPYSWTVDQTPPAITAVSVPAAMTYGPGQTLAFTVRYSEIVNVVTTSGVPYLNLLLNGGTVTTQAAYVGGSGTNALTFEYTVQNGDVEPNQVSLGANVQTNGGTIKDAAGNNANTTLQSIGSLTGVKVDGVPPTVTVSTTSTQVNGPFFVNIDFNEFVSGLTVAGLDIVGATISNLQTSDNIHYKVLITPQAGIPATLNISVPGGSAAHDAAGNYNLVSNTLTVNYDNIPPVVQSVTGPPAGYYHAGDNLDFTVQYNKNVVVTTSAGAPYLVVTIGATARVATYSGGSGTDAITFRYTVQAGDDDPDGVVLSPTMTIAPGSVKDLYGNSATTTLSNISDLTGVIVNTTRPTVIISSSAPLNVNSGFQITVIFSEAVTGFTTAGFNVVNAVVSNLQTTNNITYTATVTPVTDGAVSVSVLANAAINAGHSPSRASGTFSVNADMTAPTVTQVTVPADGYYHTGDIMTFAVQFSEPVNVSGIPSLSVTMTSGTVPFGYTGGSGTNTLTFSYTVVNGNMDMDGITLDASIIPGVATIRDAARNNATLTLNNVGNLSGVFVNTVHPTVTLSTTAPATLNTDFTVNVDFSEDVTGLDVLDFDVTNCFVTNVQATDNAHYIITVTPATTGAVSIFLKADGVQNTGLNGNTVSNTISRTADLTAPVVTQVSVPANGYYKAGDNLDFTVQFSEVVNVDASGAIPYTAVNLATGVQPAFYVSGTGTNTLTLRYTVQDGDQDMDGIELAPAMSLAGAGSITDAVGNNANLIFNNVAVTTGIFVNTTHATATLSTTAGAYVNAPFTVTTVFSEVVTGLAAGDFGVTNGTVGTLQTTDNITYTVLVTPTADGPVTVSLPADAAVNIALNGNAVSNTISVINDQTAPTITQVTVPANGYYVQGAQLNFIVTYSEPITVNTAGGTPYLPVTIGSATVNAMMTGFTANTLTFTYTVQNGDLDMDGITLGTTLVLNNATLVDVATNNANLTLNNAGNTSGVFVNTVQPSVTLSTLAAARVSGAFTVSAVFSEAVTALTASDFVVTNGTASALQTTDNINYTVTITPAADGTVTVSLPANAAVNIGGNGNSAAATLVSVLNDQTAPVIAAGQQFSLQEHTPAGTSVGMLTATEAVGTLQNWTIATDNSGGAFAINPATGEITVNDVTILDSNDGKTVQLGVTVSDGLNTSTTVTVNIQVIHVPVAPTDITIDNSFVTENTPAGTPVGNLSAVTAEPGVTFTYTLVTGSGDTDNSDFMIVGNQLQTAAVLSTAVQTSYTIRVHAVDNNGLSTEKAFTITLGMVNQAPTLDPIANQESCDVPATQTVQLTGASAVEPAQTLSYTVIADQPFFNVLTVDATGLVTYSLKPNVSGTVNVTVTVKDNGGTANGGVDTLRRTFTLTVDALPVVIITADKDTVISKGDILHLTATGGDTYAWDNADGILSGQQTAVLEVQPQTNTAYNVTATSVAGCTSTQQIRITVTDDFKVDATNILTPNGDGKNDKWVIHNLESYPDNDVTIYDRAGRIVYHRKNYSNDWDGTVNGNPLGEGTYYYILTIQGSNKTWKGYITIIRDNH